MSESEETTEEEAPESEAPRMRRRLLGYKRADVEQALETRANEVSGLEGELDAREAELVELRQDVAALWLAFAQHDRMIKSLSDATAAPAAEVTSAPEVAPTAADQAPAAEAAPAPEAEGEAIPDDASVGQQLADLDEVLAAIEMATQTLEQTYAEEIAESEEEGAVTAEAEDAAPDDAEPEPESSGEGSGGN